MSENLEIFHLIKLSKGAEENEKIIVVESRALGVTPVLLNCLLLFFIHLSRNCCRNFQL